MTPTAPALGRMPLGRRLRRIWKTIRRFVQVTAAEIWLWSFQRLPRPVAMAVGRGVGFLCHKILVNEKRRALEHLRLALGDTHTEAQMQAILRRSFTHFFETFADIAVLSGWGAERVRRTVSIEGWERVAVQVQRERERTGQGAIILCAHIGAWDLIALLAWLEWGHGAIYVARRYKVGGYNRLVKRIRTGVGGCDVTYQDDSPRKVIAQLRGGGIVGILADVDAKRVAGTFIDFFGRPAYTPVSPAALSLKLGVSIVPAFVLRAGKGYRVISDKPIDPSVVAGSDDPARDLTQRWSKLLESVIRRFPEQWVWNHDRWRTTPEILARRQEQQREREERARAARDADEASSSHLPPSPRPS